MSNLQNNIASLEALITKANALPEEKTIQSSKTVTPTTSSQTVKPDSGYDGMGQVVVNAMPTATQTTPSVSIDSAGKITATATQSAGYVAAGTKTGTKQLTTQAAKTITPTKSSQTAVAKNVYTTGAVTVAAIPSQYVTTTDASAAADDIVTGETAYVNGVKVTGTNPYEKAATDTEVTAQATTISEIMELLDGKSAPGGGGASVETCTVSIVAGGPPIPVSGELIYHDASGAAKVETWSIGSTFTVAKGSMLLLRDASVSISNTNATFLGIVSDASEYLWIINDNTTFAQM